MDLPSKRRARLAAWLLLAACMILAALTANTRQNGHHSIAARHRGRPEERGSGGGVRLDRRAEATAAQVAAARRLVVSAQQRIAADKRARMERLAGAAAGFPRPAPAPLIYPTDEELAAAALLVEADGAAAAGGGVVRRGGEEQEGGLGAPVEKRQGDAQPFWLEQLRHNGTMPFRPDPVGYRVFRNVKDFGATGGGLIDDTDAINRAIQDGNRCVGPSCKSSTVKGALVYFPSGTYLVRSSIYAIYNTQLVGNPVAPPVIKVAPSFVGYGVINTNGPAGQDQWYTPQSNFYRQIRNFKIDMTAGPLFNFIAGIHYQIAQATSVYNVNFTSSTEAGNNQQGMYMEDGSGGYIGNLLFTGGAFGLYMGNQQFTAQSLVFRSISTAGIMTPWAWTWTWRHLLFDNCTTGIALLNGDRNGPGASSVIVQDALFRNGREGVRLYLVSPGDSTRSQGVLLDNVAMVNVTAAVVQAPNGDFASGATLLKGGSGTTKINSWAVGKVHVSALGDGETFAFGANLQAKRSPKLTGTSNPFMAWSGMDYALLPKPPFLDRPKPQYEALPAGAFVQTKSLAKGDGVTDDTAALQSVFDAAAAQGKVVYVDGGAYLLSDTLTIPPGSRVVGECWAQLVASGPRFADQAQPRPLARVGKPGDVGTVEIQDLLFTSMQGTQGLVAVEWNLGAGKMAGAAMWDSHVRLGGALGTSLQTAQCPPTNGTAKPECIIGSAMMHIAASASAYLENVWLWTADHDLDFNGASAETSGRVDLYVARGLLVESAGQGVWLWATAAEHAALYQYALAGASDVVAGIVQTESPYWQPAAGAPIPAPFEKSLGLFAGDDTSLLARCVVAGNATAGKSGAGKPPTTGTTAPTTTAAGTANTSAAIEPGCDESWALRVVAAVRADGTARPTRDVQVHGAGLYSFYHAYLQDCLGGNGTNTGGRYCQAALVEVDGRGTTGGGAGDGSVWLFNLFGIGATDLLLEHAADASQTAVVVATEDNLAAADFPAAGQHRAGLVVAYQY